MCCITSSQQCVWWPMPHPLTQHMRAHMPARLPQLLGDQGPDQTGAQSCAPTTSALALCEPQAPPPPGVCSAVGSACGTLPVRRAAGAYADGVIGSIVLLLRTPEAVTSSVSLGRCVVDAATLERLRACCAAFASALLAATALHWIPFSDHAVSALVLHLGPSLCMCIQPEHRVNATRVSELRNVSVTSEGSSARFSRRSSGSFVSPRAVMTLLMKPDTSGEFATAAAPVRSAVGRALSAASSLALSARFGVSCLIA